METYSTWRPTGADASGLALEERQGWLVLPVIKTRDSGALERANFDAALASLPKGEDHETHEFGHWACGWFTIIIVRPGSLAADIAADIEAALSDYPILSDSLFSEYEQADADETWRECYRDADRVAYIRENRLEFEFRSFADMLGCARGLYFCGNTSRMAGA